MRDEPPTNEPLEAWSNRAVGIGVVIVFAAQLGVLFWLGRAPLAVRAQSENALLQLMPQIVLTPDSGPGAAFSDPTLFSRPNRRGFSGAAWRRFSGVEHQLIEWSETPRPLDNQPAALGAAFREALPDHLAVVSGIPAKGLAKPPRICNSEAGRSASGGGATAAGLAKPLAGMPDTTARCPGSASRKAAPSAVGWLSSRRGVSFQSMS